MSFLKSDYKVSYHYCNCRRPANKISLHCVVSTKAFPELVLNRFLPAKEKKEKKPFIDKGIENH